tara:strand:- start:133 stop:633 length:501 start_codon:yes stop_codon:yes gene_type:complete
MNNQIEETSDNINSKTIDIINKTNLITYYKSKLSDLDEKLSEIKIEKEKINKFLNGIKFLNEYDIDEELLENVSNFNVVTKWDEVSAVEYSLTIDANVIFSYKYNNENISYKKTYVLEQTYENRDVPDKYFDYESKIGSSGSDNLLENILEKLEDDEDWIEIMENY